MYKVVASRALIGIRKREHIGIEIVLDHQTTRVLEYLYSPFKILDRKSDRGCNRPKEVEATPEQEKYALCATIE